MKKVEGKKENSRKKQYEKLILLHADAAMTTDGGCCVVTFNFNHAKSAY